MISISTNLGALNAQNNLRYSTNSLNKAIDRLTTGSKLNAAKDNAANYAISTNMTTKVDAYQIAQDNTAYGLDLAATACNILAEMQDKTARLAALSTQARNGTYGETSLKAMNQEASAIVSELMRLYNTAEYNKVQLFNKESVLIPKSKPQAGESGFIDESSIPAKVEAGESGFIDESFTHINTDTMTTLTQAINEGKSIKGGTWAIKNVEDLKNLADITNQATDYTTGTTFVLGHNLDLSGVSWTPIGDYGRNTAFLFKGTFNGNGHKISNLNITSSGNYVGLFGYTKGAKIENLGLENVNVKGNDYVGGLVGVAQSCTFNNCYVTGDVIGSNDVIGGLIGESSSNVTNCFATGNVKASHYYVGGLIGKSSGNITNCYATGNLVSRNMTGGLVGQNRGNVTNSFATVNISNVYDHCGGLLGWNSGSVTNCYANGNIHNTESGGGLIGTNRGNITNCFATGDINGNTYTGGLIGIVECTSGYSANITNCYSTGTATGTNGVGSFIGKINNTTDQTSYGNLKITDCATTSEIGNIIGGTYKAGNVKYDYDKMDDWLKEIKILKANDISTKIQVGIHCSNDSVVRFDTNFKFNFKSLQGGIEDISTLYAIESLSDALNKKQTELGAIQNRLNSALDQIDTNIQSLVSARSTKRDADVAKESSNYIKSQILQQASATLLATANQTPSIALQLL